MTAISQNKREIEVEVTKRTSSSLAIHSPLSWSTNRSRESEHHFCSQDSLWFKNRRFESVGAWRRLRGKILWLKSTGTGGSNTRERPREESCNAFCGCLCFLACSCRCVYVVLVVHDVVYLAVIICEEQCPLISHLATNIMAH